MFRDFEEQEHMDGLKAISKWLAVRNWRQKFEKLSLF